MASDWMRIKWRMLHFIWRHQKELMLLAIIATAAGLVLVVMMEPKIPSMTEVDLSKSRQWELIDEMVKEREKKWEVEGPPDVKKEPSYDDTLMILNERNKKLVNNVQKDDVFENFDGRDPDLKDFDLDDIDDLKRRQGRRHDDPVDDEDYEADDDWFKDEEEKPELDFHHKVALEIDNVDNALKPNSKKSASKDKKQESTLKPTTLKHPPYKGIIVPIKDSPLSGGKAICTPYNLNQNLTGEFDCVTMKIKPKTTICLYPSDMDIHISRHIREEGLWEPHMIIQFQNFLYSDKNLAVIDIGANIGTYTLLAASMNHTVLAVEPFSENLRLLHKSIMIGGFQNRVTVLKNAISDERRHLKLQYRKDNQGGVALKDIEADQWCPEEECGPQAKTVYMDDLLEVINFNKALMKIDIEGHEHRAFVHSKKLLQEIYVPYIMMEWIKLKGYYGAEIDVSEDKTLAGQLVTYLTDQGYAAHSFVTGAKLRPEYWYAWPDDVLWKHKLADVK